MFSKRIQRACQENSFLVDGLAKQRQNAYHKINKPEGIINLGTAENKLLYDVISKKLENIDMGKIPEKYSHYCNFTGIDEFRDSLAVLLNCHMKPKLPIERENVFVYNGGGPAVESLGYAFCDENEGMLTPAPYYGAFYSDLRQRGRTVIYPVHLSSENKGSGAYKMTTTDLEKALKEAKESGINIKALLLSNPYNPLGTIFSLSEIEVYAEFCYSNNMHLISDEIYFFSVYNQDASMNSILSLPNFSKYQDIIHVVWAFSKDFGLSGYRCAVVITYNVFLQNAINEIAMYSTLPSFAQYVMEALITDHAWLDHLFKVSHQRLNEGLNLVTETLDKIGISYIKPSAGLFIWVNLKKYIESDSEEGETKLFHIFMNDGVYLAPGFAFGSKEHGWFRIVFSIEREELKLAMSRLNACLKATKEGTTDKVDINDKVLDVSGNIVSKLNGCMVSDPLYDTIKC